jgi:hypothetical protein
VNVLGAADGCCGQTPGPAGSWQDRSGPNPGRRSSGRGGGGAGGAGGGSAGWGRAGGGQAETAGAGVQPLLHDYGQVTTGQTASQAFTLGCPLHRPVRPVRG